ncbi:Uncharacterised protein [uncultured archaeon]|nr:Uncharacterised protein [uncultured archaeon]
MSKSEVEEVTRKTLAKGGLLTKMYFDMQSEKADDLQPLMTDLINNRLLKAPGVVYCFGEIDEPMKLENNYSTSAIVTVLFKDFWSLINVSFAFTPEGVEILKPDNEYVLKTSDMQAIVSNVSQVSLDYANYILIRVLKKEDYDKVLSDVRNREALGRKILGKEGKIE